MRKLRPKRIVSDKIEEENKIKRRLAPGRSAESRESLLISKTYDLVEKRIDNGTATSQETTYFLRMGSSMAQLERIKLEKENELLVAKAAALETQKNIEKLHKEAMRAFGIYRGETSEDDSED